MKNKNILVVVAHPDDEYLGCGGSILLWRKNNCRVNVLYVSEGVSARSDNLDRDKNWVPEIIRREEMAKSYAKVSGINIVGFMRKPNLRMNNLSMLDLVQEITQHIDNVKPDIIFTHFPGDLNSDHRVCFEAVLTACRPFTMISIEGLFVFEVPSSTNWSSSLFLPSFSPNYYTDISNLIDKKIDHLVNYDFEMRQFPHPRSPENIVSLSRIRGSEIGVKNAEAFMVVKYLEMDLD